MADDVANSEAGAATDTADAPPKVLTPAAERALREAAERRAEREALQQSTATGTAAAPEHGGRSGPDPVRYGDWENGGIASDF